MQAAANPINVMRDVISDLVLLIVVLHVRRQLNPMSWASLVGYP